MTLKKQIAERIKQDDHTPGCTYEDTARHILDLVKAHLENGGTLDE